MVIDIVPVDDLSAILREGPHNKTPGICDVGYPMLKRWYRGSAGVVLRLVNYGLRHDIIDWHTGQVLLIPKANKPDYAVVKTWWMIHLLPILAKTAERVMLGRISDDVELDATQFGSQRRKGVHDCIALAYKVFDANKNLPQAIMSVDVEGGFDNVDIALLQDIMMARGCRGVLIEWVQQWARRRRLCFWFNECASKSYYVERGIPQGSPLSPCLFGIYFADIFRCRLKYTLTVRRAVLLYVDNRLVIVAGASREVCAVVLSETFEDMDRVAQGRGMGFSAIKTDWLGFGGGWDGMDIGGIRKEPVEVLRCLGFFFNVAGDFSSHVKYWTRRALDVRRLTAAVGRWFGSIGGIGAWELWRLISTVFVPTIGYSVEWIGDNKKAVETLQIHTNHCIRSCFRTPPKTANNILLGKAGIPQWHVRLRYFRRKCYLWMISYRYSGDLPWFGCVRQSWGEEGVVPVRVRSEQVLIPGPPLCDVGQDKFAAIEMHDEIFHCASNDRDGTLAYCHGARYKDGTGAAFVIYQNGRFEEAQGHKLPDDSTVVKCELVAMLWALAHLASLEVRRAVIFTDSKAALMIISSMTPQGYHSSVWEAFVPNINALDKVAFGWSPGHAGIAGNEMADVAARQAARAGGAADELADFGLQVHGAAKRKMLSEWRTLHEREGHHYYKRQPGGGPKHWVGLSRMDTFVLMRLRTGVVEQEHGNCVDGDGRFHIQKCGRFKEWQSASDIFDDKHILDWKKWWVQHWYLGMGILRAAKYSDDVLVVGGNPFTREVFRRTPEGVICETTRLPCARCAAEDCDFLRCM